MNTIGHAVGDWNSGKKVYPNPEFVNFGHWEYQLKNIAKEQRL